MKFFIGTTNKDKVREIVSILNATGCDFEIISPIDPEETEDRFEENALLKARAYASYAKGITISEDSGLIIPSLNRLPGPWSSRFCDCDLDTQNFRILGIRPSSLTRQERDQKNNQCVLHLMKNIEQPYRAAMFKIVLVVANQSGEVLFNATGESHGWIAKESLGTNGFGYDPIFIGNDTFGKTYAELDSMRKNLKSHRHKVLNEFKAWLSQYLKKNKQI